MPHISNKLSRSPYINNMIIQPIALLSVKNVLIKLQHNSNIQIANF